MANDIIEGKTVEEKPDEKKDEYGKRPLWQWILIYLIIAVIVYGIVYYFVLSKSVPTYGQESFPSSPGTRQILYDVN